MDHERKDGNFSEIGIPGSVNIEHKLNNNIQFLKGSRRKQHGGGKSWFGQPFDIEVIEPEVEESNAPAKVSEILYPAPRGKKLGDVWVSDGGITYEIVDRSGKLFKRIVKRTDPNL